MIRPSVWDCVGPLRVGVGASDDKPHRFLGVVGVSPGWGGSLELVWKGRPRAQIRQANEDARQWVEALGRDLVEWAESRKPKGGQ